MIVYLAGVASGIGIMGLGLLIGVWITRSSGEYERRALEENWSFAVDLARGEFEAQRRGRRSDAS